MITRSEAKKRAEKVIADYWESEDDRLVIIDSETVEKDWGWVFCYTSELFLKTGELMYAVAGNAPLFVLRDDGRVLTSGTSHGLDYYIDKFESTGDPNG